MTSIGEAVKPVVFEIDDLCDQYDPLDKLILLKDRFPGLKVTVFAIPGQSSPELLEAYSDLDWVELAVHGYHHSTMECSIWTKAQTIDRLREIEKEWPGVKGFKAPGWCLNEEVCSALQYEGWWLADHIEHVGEWGTSRLPRYVYNDTDVVLPIHGHTWDTMGNGPSAWDEMFREVDNDAEFKFVSSVVEVRSRNVEIMDVGTGAATEVTRLVASAGYDVVEPQKASKASAKLWPWWGVLRDNAEHVRRGDYLYVHHINSAHGLREVRSAVNFGLRPIVSCNITKEIVDSFGVFSDKIPYLVPKPEGVPPKADKFRVGILGAKSATEYKNFDQILRVCGTLGIEVVDWTVDKIDFSRDLNDFWPNVACVVNASKCEGGPLPPLEALSRGRFVVSTKVGIMPEVISDGLFFYDGSDGQLADGLRKARDHWDAQIEPLDMLPGWLMSEKRWSKQWREALG